MSQQQPSPTYPPASGQPVLPGQPSSVPVAVPAQNTPATASLVLGIVSIVTSLLFVPAILGIVFGILGVKRAGQSSPPVGKGKAVTGIVLSIVALVVGMGIVNAISGGDSPTPAGVATSITQDADGGAEEPAGDAEDAAEPTQEPAPAPPPVDPFAEEYGTFEPVTASGTGKSVVTLPPG